MFSLACLIATFRWFSLSCAPWILIENYGLLLGFKDSVVASDLADLPFRFFVFNLIVFGDSLRKYLLLRVVFLGFYFYFNVNVKRQIPE